jgi:two-component system, chemotaxis family, chemotaxis protein CheY
VTQQASAAVLKLKPVLDMGAAEEFLVTMRQHADANDGLQLDASAVKTITTPCIQIVLSAISNNGASVLTPSDEFVAAFSDTGLSFPQSEPIVVEAVAVDDHNQSDNASAETAPAIQLTADEGVASPSLSESEEPEVKSMAKRILTIDDSKTIRDMLKMTLVDAGFEVLQAVDGQDGVEVMEREEVDLVITDINMPKMNGYEVVRHLRSIPAHKGLPILVLTTESDNDKKNLAREAGATGWMVKPFDPDRLVATVRKVIP